MKPETISALSIDPRSAEYMSESLAIIETKFAAAVGGVLAMTRLEQNKFAASLIGVLDGIAERLIGTIGGDAERIRWAFEREAYCPRAEFRLSYAADVTLYLYWSWKVEIRAEKAGTHKLTLRPKARVEIGSPGTLRSTDAALAIADLLRESAAIGTRVSMMAKDLYITAWIPSAVTAK